MTAIKETDAREALGKTSLRKEHIEAAVAGLRRAGLVESSNAMYASSVQAAARPVRTLAEAAKIDVIHARLVARVASTAAHFGISLNLNEPPDSRKISDDLKARGVSVEDRLRFKSSIAQCDVAF